MKKLEPQRAQLNSTKMIQDIVAILKNPPFNETIVPVQQWLFFPLKKKGIWTSRFNYKGYGNDWQISSIR